MKPENEIQCLQILIETYTAYVGCYGCSASSSLNHQVHGIDEEIQIFVSAAYVGNLAGFLCAPVRDLNDHCADSHGHFLPEKYKIFRQTEIILRICHRVV
jgi:hypothetical protein